MLWTRIDFSADPDQAYLVNADPDAEQGQGFDDKKLNKFIAEIFFTKTCYVLIPRTFSTSELEISSLLRVIFALLDQNNKNECGSGSTILLLTELKIFTPYCEITSISNF